MGSTSPWKKLLAHHAAAADHDPLRSRREWLRKRPSPHSGCSEERVRRPRERQQRQRRAQQCLPHFSLEDMVLDLLIIWRYANKKTTYLCYWC